MVVRFLGVGEPTEVGQIQWRKEKSAVTTPELSDEVFLARICAGGEVPPDASAPISSSQIKEEEKSQRLAEAGESVSLQAETSDEVLICQVGENSREALAMLFRRYAHAVRSVAYRALRDASEADDLVQDIFLLVRRDAKAFNHSRGSARAWILQIAHRRAISRHRYLRSRHFYDRVDLDDLAGELGDPRAMAEQTGNPIEEVFGEAGFQTVFEELSLNQRETLRLHFFEGYTLGEIAAKLCQSQGNIKHHYFRGLERLRKQLFSGKLLGKRTVQ